jgi:O-antigen/teichoic acid export membrane protein
MEENSSEQNKSYNQIFKSFGLFGGVQVFTIIIIIIRSKFVAIYLGTTGLGIMGLLTSTIVMLVAISSFGLNVSVVNSISKISNIDDQNLFSKSIITIRRWINFTAVLGAVLTLALSTKLSQWVFGNNDYNWAFIWLSLNVFFQALSNGKSALLQGLRKLEQLAKVGVLGSTIGLFISLPLFYFYGIQGIIPSLVLTAATTFIISWFFDRKIQISNVNISIHDSFYDGIDMVKLGGVFLITNLFGTGILYIVQVFINKTGGVEQVGLFLSSFAIINGYFGMIFTAMGTDLFPRISAISDNDSAIKSLINQQSIIMILILAPLLICLISALPLVINILLTSKFIPIIGLLKWAIFGVIFQAITYPFGLIIAAKGDSKMYFWLVMTLHITTLISYVISYHFFKLEGIGLAFIFVNFLFFLILLRFAKVNYFFTYERHFVKIFLIQFFLIIIAFAIVLFFGYPISYYTGIIITLTSILYSLFELKKRIDFSTILQKIKRK